MQIKITIPYCYIPISIAEMDRNEYANVGIYRKQREVSYYAVGL